MGPPGAGKSTISEKISTSVPYIKSTNDVVSGSISNIILSSLPKNIRSYLPYSVGKKLSMLTGLESWSIESFKLNNPGLYQSIGTNLNKYVSDPSERSSTINGYLSLSSKYSLCHYAPTEDDYVIFDGGFSHRSESIFCTPHGSTDIDIQDVENYLSKVPDIDVVIHLDIDKDTCFRRMTSRTDGFPPLFDGLSGSEIKSHIEKMKNHYSHVSDILHENGVCVLTIQTENESNELVQEMKNSSKNIEALSKNRT